MLSNLTSLKQDYHRILPAHLPMLLPVMHLNTLLHLQAPLRQPLRPLTAHLDT